MNKKLASCILLFLCACSVSCRMLHDDDIAPGSSWLYLPTELYLPTDNQKPDFWLDLSVYLDDKIIVQKNLPLVRIEASCAAIRFPIKTIIADGFGTGTCEHLEIGLNKSNHEGIGLYFKLASVSKQNFDLVQEELMIPFNVHSKGQLNRVSYSAHWRKE